MKHTIFFSWQSDTPTISGRNLVERALDRAVGAIGRDTEVEEAVREGLEVDRDTKGVSGSPPIVETIFKKIDLAAVFVADLTFAGRRSDGAPIPNPNVLIEYGWALKSLGHTRIISIMNIAFGNPTDEEMPFDMRHLRHPIQYECPDGADDETRKKVRMALAKRLEEAIKNVIDSDDFKASLPKPPKPLAFPAKDPMDGPGRFRTNGEPLGVSDDMSLLANPYDIYLEEGPAIWLRVMPDRDPGRRWTVTDIRKTATSSGRIIMPINDGAGSYGYVRAADGFGLRLMLTAAQNVTSSVVFAFNTGEVWTIDSYLLAAMASQTPGVIPLDENAYAKALEEYAEFLLRLGVQPPFRWIAGLEGVKGRGLYIPAPPGSMSLPFPRGSCVVDNITAEGQHEPGTPARHSLRPLFEEIYEKCGLERPAWMNR